MIKSIRLLGLLLGMSVSIFVPLKAMDMNRVNALAEQIKAGMVTQQIPKNIKSVTAEPKVVKHDESITIPSKSTEVTEKSLGLRKTDLYTEEGTKPEKTKYTTDAPGASKRFDRAYENAPPMIPHSVDGLLPITKGNNSCLGCHMPDVAPSMGATPIPPTHFTNFRPMTEIETDGTMVKEGVGIVNTTDIKVVARREDKLYQGRFNCTQCHAPQAQIKPLVKNTFTPDFRKADEKHKSNLIDVMNEGVQ